ncbi:MAG: hypothetical protein WDZ49_17590 [Litorilinea sp.]
MQLPNKTAIPRQTPSPRAPDKAVSTQLRTGLHTGLRLVLLFLVLAAFARLTWQVGAKSIWWDESLSLQRAEQGWLPLLLGHLIMVDGIDSQLTIDQHPFFYFLLQGILVRVAGISEYALRFVSVMAATLFVPALWTWSRALVRRGSAPPATPVFVALLATISPFYLWFGQEARPYTLWALLAVLSTYWLLRVAWPLALPSTHGPSRGAWFAYGVTLAALLATHYYSVFLLPLHALAWFLRLYTRRPRLAVGVAGTLLLGGAAVSALANYRIIILQGGGGNFSAIRLDVLVPDLLNAYSLGLSVDINQGWWLDLIYGAVALVGVAWLIWRPRRLWAGGWLPVLVVGVPVLAVLVLNLIIPAYMTARHLSLIGGGYLLLLGMGLAALWEIRRGYVYLWGAAPLTLLLVAGAGYSTLNFYTDEIYRHNDFEAVGRYLASNMADGDLILLNPPFSWRIFEYYLPLDVLDRAAAQGAQVQRLGVPRFVDSWATREAELAAVTAAYRRIWVVKLGTHPFLDLEGRTEAWLDANLFRLNTRQFFSHSELSVTNYVPQVPVTWDAPPMPQPHSVTFGDQIRLAGYGVGTDLSDTGLYDHLGLPVTLYWQTLAETDRRYKYRLRLVAVADEDSDPDADPQITQEAALTEREPYDGAIPTIYWAPGQTIVEYTELAAHANHWQDLRQNPQSYRLALEVYDAETLEKLPVSAMTGAAHSTGETVFLPYATD